MKNYIVIIALAFVSIATHAAMPNQAPRPTDTVVHWDSVNNMAYVNIVPVNWVRFENPANRLYLALVTDNLYSQAMFVWQVRCTDTVDSVTFNYKVLQSGTYTLSGSDYSTWTGDIPYIFDFIADQPFLNVTID
jgi:hypothetical protein